MQQLLCVLVRSGLQIVPCGYIRIVVGDTQRVHERRQRHIVRCGSVRRFGRDERVRGRVFCVPGREVRERDGKHIVQDVRGGQAQRQRECLVCVRAVWRGPVPERGGPGAVRRVSYGQVRRRVG